MFGFVMINLLHFCDAGLSQLCDAENTGITYRNTMLNLNSKIYCVIYLKNEAKNYVYRYII